MTFYNQQNNKCSSWWWGTSAAYLWPFWRLKWCTVHTRLKNIGHIRWLFVWHFASGNIVGANMRSEKKREIGISSTFTQWFLCFIFALCSSRLCVWSVLFSLSSCFLSFSQVLSFSNFSCLYNFSILHC